MFSDYYSLLFGTGLFTLAYFYVNPSTFKNMSSQISWYSVKTYHSLNIIMTDYFYTEEMEQLENNDFEEEENEREIILEGLNGDNKFESFNITENEKVEDVDISDFKVLFVEIEKDNKKYYKNISLDEDLKNLFNLDVEPIKRQFLQIELEQDSEKTDIHEHISSYYVNGNTLFSKYFMKYYMEKYYSKDMETIYKINIIDKDITLLNIDNCQHIDLNECGYTVNKI